MDTAVKTLKLSPTREAMLNVIADTLKHEEQLFIRDVQSVGGAGKSDVRIMQWNMLAQALACSDDGFIKCPPEALNWDKRRLYVLQEILHYDPDIVCLEEVDNFQFFNELLTKIDYDGYFRPKLDSPCNNITPNYGPDGCACFWKRSKVESLRKTSFVLAPDNDYTNQIALFLTFKRGEFEFGVVVTHLKAKPGYDELREAQGASILEYLKENAASLPLVICGDFNGVPEESFYKTFVSSDLDLFSTYTKLTDDGSEPPFTTWKFRTGNEPGQLFREVCWTIDYVWCSRKHFDVKGLIKLPTESQVGETRLPSHRYPSDHLSLIVDFKFKSNI